MFKQKTILVRFFLQIFVQTDWLKNKRFLSPTVYLPSYFKKERKSKQKVY